MSTTNEECRESCSVESSVPNPNVGCQCACSCNAAQNKCPDCGKTSCNGDCDDWDDDEEEDWDDEDYWDEDDEWEDDWDDDDDE